jgi:aspartyl-tRNA(Asn)/glutamyl-tRNA(Gln) amidotransferase subunit B
MSFSMREKEEAADYRYFPNPELMPIHIDEQWIELVRKELPTPAHVRFERMTKELNLPEYDSGIITSSLNLCHIFDGVLEGANKPKEVVNWIMGDLLSITKAAGVADDDIEIDCAKFAQVIKLVDDKTINRAVGKKLLIKVYEDSIDPIAYVEENSLGMVSDTGVLESAIKEVLENNEKSVNEYRAGSQKVFGFLVGQVMKKTAGKADPQTVNEMLKKMLSD